MPVFDFYGPKYVGNANKESSGYFAASLSTIRCKATASLKKSI